MTARIVCRVPPGETRTFELPRGEAILGSEKGDAVELALEGVSRRHARITWDGTNYWIEDLRSASRTYLNGLAVERETLRHLDVIGLGRKVDVIFVRRDEAPALTREGVLAATLVPLSPDLAPVELPLGETTLGRNTACNVVLDKAAISKMHASLERTSEGVRVRDLESMNGTFVNGARVESAVLRDQDLVSLAGVEEFRVSIHLGDVVTTRSEPAPSSASGTTPSSSITVRFSNEWKTRFDWSEDEKGESPDLLRTLVPTAKPEQTTSALPVAPTSGAAPRIARVRLKGTRVDLVVTEPGLRTIGRSADAALRIGDATVSRQHARLILTEDRSAALLQDLGGANGTLLNGAPLRKAEPLGDGDLVQLGEVQLLVEIQMQPRD